MNIFILECRLKKTNNLFIVKLRLESSLFEFQLWRFPK